MNAPSIGAGCLALGVWLALSGAACSERNSVEVVAVSCELLRGLPKATGGLPELDDVAWLVVSPSGETPLVANWRDARLGGETCRRVAYLGKPWLVCREWALSADFVETGAVRGRWLICGTSLGSVNHSGEVGVSSGASEHVVLEHMPSEYAASPLAPLDQTSNVDVSHGGPARRLQLLGQYPPAGSQLWANAPTSDLALVGQRLLAVARSRDGLRILELDPDDPGNPKEVGWVRPRSLGDDFNDVAAIDGRYVAVASSSVGLLIVDLEEASRPRIVAESLPWIAPREGHSVHVEGKRLFLAQAPLFSGGALVAFDISEPTSPRELWRWKDPEGHDVHDVTVRRDRAYVSSLRGGITVLDWSLGGEPNVVFSDRRWSAHSCSLVGTSGDRLLWAEETVGGSLHAAKVSPGGANAPFRSTPITARFERRDPSGGAQEVIAAASPHQAECYEADCFIAHYQLGLRVVGLDDFDAVLSGAAPPLRAAYSTWVPSAASERTWLRGASGVALNLPHVYVADTEAGVLVLRYGAATPEQ